MSARQTCQMPRTFAIGDIHGRLDLLGKMIEHLAPASSDRLVFLGDYVDRGPDSKGVIDYLIDLAGRQDCVFLKGNHEDILIDFLNQAGKYSWLTFIYNGGLATLASYEATGAVDLRRKMPPPHRDFLEGLCDTYEDDCYIYVHAGLAPDPADEDPYGTLYWIREAFIYSPKDFGKKVVFGHTPQAEPLLMPNKICVDTGAVFSGRLSAIELPAERIHQVSL